MTKLMKAELELADYICNDYEAGKFETSWDTYSMCATREETLLSNFVNAVDRADDSYFLVLPELLVSLATRYIVDKTDEAAAEVFEKFSIFIGDAMRSLAYCELRESW